MSASNAFQLYRLSALGLLKITGSDSEKFLQGQLTCDVRMLPGESCFGAHCTPQGRVISLFRLFKIDATFYLLMPRNMIDIAMIALKKYAVFFKTELYDASNEMCIIGQSGSLSTMNNLNEYITVAHDASRHFLIVTPTNLESITPAAMAEAHAWHKQDIQARIPTIYPETSGKFLPHELNLQSLGALNFDKGCYTGQEIIARMQYRGKLKNHLYFASITSAIPPLPGDDIFTHEEHQGNACGTVVDLVEQAYNNYMSLIISNEANALSQHLFLKHDANVFFQIHQN